MKTRDLVLVGLAFSFAPAVAAATEPNIVAKHKKAKKPNKGLQNE